MKITAPRPRDTCGGWRGVTVSLGGGEVGGGGAGGSEGGAILEEGI